MKPALRRSAYPVISSALLLCGCAIGRPPVPPGTVPRQYSIAAAEEQYGHQVFSALMERYQLDTDDDRINRARDIVDKLSQAAQADQNPWHVHVLKDDNFKNAAATRGNYIFIWTGMYQAVQDDDELATILAHEMGHVLAGHTMPHPIEEVNRILSGVAGNVAGRIVAQQGGYSGIVISLSEMLVTEAVEALLVKPEAQRQELEADHIGLFLMADAGMNPSRAVEFWERVSADPEFSGFPIAFLSTHPSSAKRVAGLRGHLPEALRRYNEAKGDSAAITAPRLNTASTLDQKRWIVAEPRVSVYQSADTSSKIVANLSSGEIVEAEELRGRWLQIGSPYKGFVQSFLLAPAGN